MICKNCNTNFEGNYCSNCGEKVVKDSDFTLMKISSQALDSITHLDSKLFKTIKLLFFFPGKLSLHYTEGIRIPYMKPFQIFIISNILFFIMLSNDDIFRIPSFALFQENFEGIKVLEKVRAISKNTGLSSSEVAKSYDYSSTNLAKTFLVFLIPLIAFIGKILNKKAKMEFGKHLIFATHFFAFVLSFLALTTLLLFLFPSSFNNRMLLIPIGISILIYYSVALKNFYKNSNAMAVIKGISGIILIFVLFNIYRMLISAIALYSL